MELLASVGLRSTAPRLAVLGVLARAPHSTAAQVAEALNTPLSHQGLYNVLADLARAGLVRAVDLAGQATRYELRTGSRHHHHLVCRTCGRIADVDCATTGAPCLVPAHGPGFGRVDEVEVTWWGTCDTCLTAAAPPATAHPPPPGRAPSRRRPSTPAI